jgi:hypothetical protein
MKRETIDRRFFSKSGENQHPQRPYLCSTMHRGIVVSSLSHISHYHIRIPFPDPISYPTKQARQFSKKMAKQIHTMSEKRDEDEPVAKPTFLDLADVVG